jgi:hypothetical protein
MKWRATCPWWGMTLLEKVSDYHSTCRPAFVLFAEFIGFVGTMAIMVGVAVLFSLFH